MSKQVIVPPPMRGLYEEYHFAPMVRAGDWLIFSGQIGVDPQGEVPRDAEKQFECLFETVQMLLAEAGADFSQVVELNSYHLDFAHTIEIFGAVKDRYIAEPYPAWTAVEVAGLALPGALAELKLWAHLG